MTRQKGSRNKGVPLLRVQITLFQYDNGKSRGAKPDRTKSVTLYGLTIDEIVARLHA